jgi:hypothetical protein
MQAIETLEENAHKLCMDHLKGLKSKTKIPMYLLLYIIPVTLRSYRLSVPITRSGITGLSMANLIGNTRNVTQL